MANIQIPQKTTTTSTRPIDTFSTSGRTFNMIDNYMYMYHTDTFIVLPTYPESVSDSMSASFASTTPLSRSAPIYSYQNSGPRSVQISLKLQRELMTQINWQRSNATVQMGDDYVDTIIKQIQAAVIPRYGDAEKMVNPPIVAVRFGDDIFIKGVVNGSVSLTYQLPIITDKNGKDKYSIVDINFTVSEVDPYDADTVMLAGSYRGLSTTLERNLWKVSTSGSLGFSGGSSAAGGSRGGGLSSREMTRY